MYPFDRARRLFSHAASIPWLIFIWGVAEIVERVEFIATKLHDLWGAVMTPVGSLALVGIGFFGLVLVVIWPDVKRKLPPLHFFQSTDHERIGLLGADITALREQIAVYQSRVESTEARIVKLEFLSDTHGEF